MKAYDALVAVLPSKQRSEHFEKNVSIAFGHTNFRYSLVIGPPLFPK
jgi:hypothetical protein